jgi:GT2 family glycosyltransferase
MQFTIVIPTYNSAETLCTLLDSLSGAMGGGVEVIVVDDASTDATETLAPRYAIRYERLERNGGPAAARNLGAALARGEWLVFTDADTVFLPDTMDAIRTTLGESDADALVGTYAGVPANEGFVPRFKALWEEVAIDRVLAPNGERLTPHCSWAPRPGLVRRAAFEAVGGFDTRFRGADLEDLDLGYRLLEKGYKIHFAPGIRIRHHYPASVRAELKPFARRCAIWTRMNWARRKMDSAGEGSPGQALGHLCGFAALGLIIAGCLYPPLWLGAGVAAAAHVILHRRFLAAAYGTYGAWFAVRALGMCWLRTLVMGFAVAYALATLGRR